METITCRCGHVCAAAHKFCENCGAPLHGDPVRTPAGTGTAPAREAKLPVNIYPDDEGLRLLVDCCNQSAALPIGSFLSEQVLYENEQSGGYELHVYRSGRGDEIHEGYTVSPEAAKRILDRVHPRDYAKENATPDTLGGGTSVIKFLDGDGKINRVECHTDKGLAAFAGVRNQMRAEIRPENRIVPEAAKRWKAFSVFSTGMSMTACYRYELIRTEEGRLCLRGSTFVGGSPRDLSDWVPLPPDVQEALDAIPLGLMISSRVPAPNPFGVGSLMVLDAGSSSCSITYADGRTDEKTPDGELLHALDTLLKRFFTEQK